MHLIRCICNHTLTHHFSNSLVQYQEPSPSRVFLLGLPLSSLDHHLGDLGDRLLDLGDHLLRMSVRKVYKYQHCS